MNENLFNKIDIIIAPAVLLVIMSILFFKKKKQPAAIQKYFFPAFFLRIFGAIAISVIVEFVYAYGDTYHYYNNAQALRTYFLKDPAGWFEILFSNPKSGTAALSDYYDLINSFNSYSGIVFQSNENATAAKIASIFNLICFNSSLGIAFFFGLLSFLGCWYIFKTFVHIYPGYEKKFAWLCLYLPSLWFWGSGILKDPICIFALGLIFFNFFVKKGSLFKRIIMTGLGIFLLMNIKAYILYSFSAALILGWSIYNFKKLNIAGKLAAAFFLVLIIIASYNTVTEVITDSYNQILTESKNFIKSYTMDREAGDATLAPVFDPSLPGLIKLSMNGLVNVFMRPFPWQINKILYLFLIMENLFLYYIIFRKVESGPVDFKYNHRFLTNFSFVFFIFFGLVVGITSFNLGTIARYRVPALPFLFAGIFSLKLANRKKRMEAPQATAQ